MSKYFIMIEGPNNAGKTTLLETIIKNTNLNFERIKCSQPKGNPFFEYKKIIDLTKQPTKKNYIIDRFHWGEFVYSYMYRNGPEMTIEQFHQLENEIIQLNDYKHLMIYCKTDVDKAAERHLINKEEYVKIEDISEEIELFENIYKQSNLSIETYTIGDDINKILNHFS